nr:myosin heavy chain, clone 203-like [Nicotiana tomentosiformis]
MAEAPELGRVEAVLLRAGEADKETVAGTSRSEYNVPKDALGTLKGHLTEGPQGAADSFHNFLDDLDSTTSEDVTGLGDQPVPKKIPSPGVGGSSSSPNLVNRFPAPSVDPTRKRAIFMSIPEDARVLSSPMGTASYLRCLVSVETRDLIEKKDAKKLLSEKSQAELEAARKEHADLVQKKLDQIEQLQGEVDTVKAEAEEWKKNMDRLAKKIERLQSQLNSAVSGQEILAKKLEAAKSEVVVVRAETDDMVAQHKANAEAIQDQARHMTAKIYEAKARKLAYSKEDSEGSKESGESDGSEDPVDDDAAPDED